MCTLCIVPCGNRKIWGKYPDKGATKAKDVYIGPFTSKCGKYAMHFYPDSWYILSAKYGFLHPEDIVPNLNKNIRSKFQKMHYYENRNF